MQSLSSRILCVTFTLWLLAACTTSEVLQNPVSSISIASLSVDGPYSIRAYTSFPDVPEFGNATIYYPLDVAGQIGAVAISPGFTERQRHINWWGPRLASHGFATLVLDTNELRDSPALRGDALIAAVRLLKAENTRADSPLYGRVDADKLAVMGHSMGGGGALIAAHNYSDEIQAAIPFTSWQPDLRFEGITVPTLVIAGAADRIAPVAVHAWPHFQSIPKTTTRVYLEVAGGNHFIANSGASDNAMLGRYAIAWLKLYLDGDERYREFIYGEAQKVDADRLSRYITNP